MEDLIEHKKMKEHMAEGQEQADLMHELCLLHEENQAALRLLWAAAHANNGELRIPNSSMGIAGQYQILESFYDVEKKETVFIAKVTKPIVQAEEIKIPNTHRLKPSSI